MMTVLILNSLLRRPSGEPEERSFERYSSVDFRIQRPKAINFESDWLNVQHMVTRQT